METEKAGVPLATENVESLEQIKNLSATKPKPAKAPKITESDFDSFQAFFGFVTSDFKKYKKMSAVKFCLGRTFDENAEIYPSDSISTFWKLDKQLDIPAHFIKEISASGNSSPYLDAVLRAMEQIICKHPALKKFEESSLTELDFKNLDDYLLSLSFIDVEMQDSSLFTRSFRESLRKNISGSTIHLNVYRGKWKLLEAISAAGNSIWYKSSSSAELATGKIISAKEVSAIGAVYRKFESELRREQLKLEKLTSELDQLTFNYERIEKLLEEHESEVKTFTSKIESLTSEIENLQEAHTKEKTMLTENGIRLSSDLNNLKGRVKTSLESSLDSLENGLHALQSGKNTFAENFISETIEKLKKHLKDI